MYHSSNSIVRTVFNNALYNSNSCTGYKMAYFRNNYAIDIIKHDPSYVFSLVKVTGTFNNIAHSAAVDNLLTLLHVRSDISYIEGFDSSDINDLIKNFLPRFDIPYFIQPLFCNLYLTFFFKIALCQFFLYTRVISYIAKNYFSEMFLYL